MATTIDDFSKIWASTSPLTPYEFSENNYKQGWDFVGATPPSRQMWDSLQKNNDEKMQYLANNYLPLSGGTINGELTLNTSSGTRLLHLYQNGSPFATLGVTGPENGQGISLLSKDGSFGDSFLSLYPSNKSSDPSFALVAGNGTTTKGLVGRPDGTLTWDGVGVGGTYLGVASSGVATNFTLPKNGTYLIITGHNSNAETNSIWIARISGNNVFKMAGGSNITMTCSNKTITVTSSTGSAGVYYIYLG